MKTLQITVSDDMGEAIETRAVAAASRVPNPMLWIW